MHITSIAALADNYIWIITNEDGDCIIVDPGEGKLLLEIMQCNKWTPKAILLTHNHLDHVQGVKILCSSYPGIVVYGPRETKLQANVIVRDGMKLKLLGYEFIIILTPGHTLGHISYYCDPHFFCGDVLFSGGCGKILGGTIHQMYKSLQKINNFPDNTLLYCAHEYTLSNMQFAITILPKDPDIIEYYKQIKKMISSGNKTIPTILNKERKINLFLRVLNNNFKDIINNIKIDNFNQFELFAYLRDLKNNFLS